MPAHAFPPGPSTLAALRGLRALGGSGDLADVPEFLTGLAQRYGGIAHWTLLGRHFFFIDDPALIEEALVTRVPDYRKGRGIERLKRLLGEGLLSSEEPLHLRQRRLLQPAFARERIAAYGLQMVTATVDHIDGWADDSRFAIDAEMNRLTLTIAARTLFGADVGDRIDAIRAALTTLMRAFPASISRFSELLDALPMLPVTRRFLRARAELDRAIYAIIAARRSEPAAAANDVLGMLLAARDADGGMNDGQLRDEMMTLFIAGHETTANALAWTWYLLGRHPHVGARLRAELDSVLGGRLPDPADVPRLTYVRDVVAETMRLYPPAWVLGRRALRDTSLGGQAVPRGSVVLASQLVTQTNPRYWPRPATFSPERWSDGGVPAAKFAYFPFGGGNRRCIGESFAWMEMVLIVATVAQRFSIELLDRAPVDTEPLVTLRPRTPIRVRVTDRRRTAL